MRSWRQGHALHFGHGRLHQVASRSPGSPCALASTSCTERVRVQVRFRYPARQTHRLRYLGQGDRASLDIQTAPTVRLQVFRTVSGLVRTWLLDVWQNTKWLLGQGERSSGPLRTAPV